MQDGIKGSSTRSPACTCRRDWWNMLSLTPSKAENRELDQEGCVRVWDGAGSLRWCCGLLGVGGWVACRRNGWGSSMLLNCPCAPLVAITQAVQCRTAAVVIRPAPLECRVEVMMAASPGLCWWCKQDMWLA